MKNIFIGWITFQLIVIGIVSVSTHNDVVNKTHVCIKERSTVPIFMGAVFPLVYFLSSDDFGTEEYCLLQEITNKDI